MNYAVFFKHGFDSPLPFWIILKNCKIGKVEHSSFKAITLLIKKASYCISICLYMLNPKLIAFPSKERSDPDWGLPSQSLRAVHCEAGQTHPPTDTHRYQRQPQPTHNHDRQLKHTYILIDFRANWPNSQNFCWGPSLCPLEFITVNFQHHEFLLILILFSSLWKNNCELQRKLF